MSFLYFDLLDIYAFVILKDTVSEEPKEIETTLKGHIKKQIGKFAVPEKLLVSQHSSNSDYLCDYTYQILYQDCSRITQDTFW